MDRTSLDQPKHNAEAFQPTMIEYTMLCPLRIHRTILYSYRYSFNNYDTTSPRNFRFPRYSYSAPYVQQETVDAANSLATVLDIKAQAWSGRTHCP